MTDTRHDERTDALVFTVENLSGIVRDLIETQKRHEEHIALLTENLSNLTQGVGRLADVMGRVVDVQEKCTTYSEAKFHETDGQARHTEQRLDALIDILEQHLNNGHLHPKIVSPTANAADGRGATQPSEVGHGESREAAAEQR